MVSEDTEITLGMGRLMGLFFLLVAICAVFFSIGYSLGKSTAREQALNDQSSQVLAAAPPQSQDKPSAAIVAHADAKAPAQDQAADSNSSSPLTFYKAVQQSGTSAPPPAKGNPPAAAPKAPAAEAEPAPVEASKSVHANDAAQSTAPPIGHSAPVTGAGTVVVQVAALSREDDAVALAGALRKKSYNVFVVNNPANSDKFYHVQVGPFTTVQDADAMKAKLVAEGYNPIVKR
jgi:cell division septation protein DedD